MSIAQEHAQKIERGTPLLTDDVDALLAEVPGWTLDRNEIERTFQFGDFRQAIDFVNRVADIVEAENHHPDIHISYNKVRLVFTTHKVGGLSRNDFVMAAKVNQLV